MSNDMREAFQKLFGYPMADDAESETFAKGYHAAISDKPVQGVEGWKHAKHEEAFEFAFREFAKKIWHCEPVEIGHQYKLVHSVAKMTFDAGYEIGCRNFAAPTPPLSKHTKGEWVEIQVPSWCNRIEYVKNSDTGEVESVTFHRASFEISIGDSAGIEGHGYTPPAPITPETSLPEEVEPFGYARFSVSMDEEEHFAGFAKTTDGWADKFCKPLFTTPPSAQAAALWIQRKAAGICDTLISIKNLTKQDVVDAIGEIFTLIPPSDLVVMTREEYEAIEAATADIEERFKLEGERMALTATVPLGRIIKLRVALCAIVSQHMPKESK